MHIKNKIQFADVFTDYFITFYFFKERLNWGYQSVISLVLNTRSQKTCIRVPLNLEIDALQLNTHRSSDF